MKKLKQTMLGLYLYRLSRTRFGRPLEVLAQLVQSEEIQPQHLIRANARHNRKQVVILERFETERTVAK
jgi:hypothetical protein